MSCGWGTHMRRDGLDPCGGLEREVQLEAEARELWGVPNNTPSRRADEKHVMRLMAAHGEREREDSSKHTYSRRAPLKRV